MKNEVTLDRVKFWLDQHVIHCRFNGNIDKHFVEVELEGVFVEVISSFSEGHYKPIVIDLTQVSDVNALRLFKRISRSARMKTKVISKSFIVKSLLLKILLKLNDISNDGVVPIKISTSYESAIEYGNLKYGEFNAC